MTYAPAMSRDSSTTRGRGQPILSFFQKEKKMVLPDLPVQSMIHQPSCQKRRTLAVNEMEINNTLNRASKAFQLLLFIPLQA